MRIRIAMGIAVLGVCASALALAPGFSWTGPVQPGSTSCSWGLRHCVIGDVNGDGMGDILVSKSEANGPSGVSQGLVCLISGSDGSLLSRLWGQAAYANFGAWLSEAGDVNQDGHADFLVLSRTTSPTISLFSGYDRSLLRSWGYSGARIVIGGRDLDGDSIPDCAAIDNWSGIRIWSGSTGTVIRDINAGLGFYENRLAWAGDVDGDGFPDLMVSAPDFSLGRGTVRLLSGRDGSELWGHWAQPGEQSLGINISTAGDVNGDGYDDYLIGYRRSDVPQYYRTGTVALFAGGSFVRLHSWRGEEEEAYFGTGYASLSSGDVDGDGRSDVIVGARGHGLGSTGKAYVFSGNGYHLLSAVLGEAGQVTGGFGYAVSSGDVNGDGRADVLVGAPGCVDLSGHVTGKVYLFMGQ